MASKAYESNYKAWLLSTRVDSFDPENGSTVGATELDAGTRLLRLVSAGGIQFTYNQNTASQALVDEGKISHNLGTREVTGVSITHEIDFPLSGDDMWGLYSYGDEVDLVVAPEVDDATGEPADGEVVHIFRMEVGESQPVASAQDTKQNFVVGGAVQNWDFDATFDTSA